jgi:hypothetical protein
VEAVLAAMTQATMTQDPQPETIGGREHEDRHSMETLVAVLNRAIARKRSTGMENTDHRS